MRRTLAGIALAVTTMVALSFLIPLSLLVRSEARTQAITAAEQRAAALAPVLALTTDTASLRQAAASVDADDRLAVHLPDAPPIGTSHAPAALLGRAQREGAALTGDVPGGWAYLQPVVLNGGRVAVIEEFVPRAELTRGVAESWWVMAALALGLVLGSVLVADRLAARVVRSSRRLSHAAHTLGAGRLDARVEPMGPPELHEAGIAFNAMADRMVHLVATERELVADLSHRLRTPLTVLRLAAEQAATSADSQRITAAVGQLEAELKSIIETARAPLAVRPAGGTVPAAGLGAAHHSGAGGAAQCSAAEVTAARAAFWATLARQQNRPFDLQITPEPTTVAVPEDELTAVIDALAGNVFRHTPPGAAFAIRLERSASAVTLTVTDAGPGIADPEAALARGGSDGSTGLGLDIARRAAGAADGSVRLTRGPLGGADIAVTFGLADEPVRRGARTRRRRRRRGLWAYR
ncbi:ATP-binding protein [Streptomyces sp. V4-01]|uniref:Signal transduction histidine-protein kinase/phosphatase MprB n=1 Tax=Actinacidiphila polyblastidii TaxID=3110430 RepID=A0ABU7PH62_9ACTN|nr:ATP-binding protein [Streptomyces sp. V4-01]